DSFELLALRMRVRALRPLRGLAHPGEKIGRLVLLRLALAIRRVVVNRGSIDARRSRERDRAPARSQDAEAEARRDECRERDHRDRTLDGRARAIAARNEHELPS